MKISLWIGWVVSLLLTFGTSAGAQGAETARGTVYHDRNRNQVRDPGEPGLPGVRVSNQVDVTETDANGRWELPAREEAIFFVIKPSGWGTPVDDQFLPRFYHIHKPTGSPKMKFAGVSATGPLPESIDFPLHQTKEPERFHAIFFGDPQPRDQREVDYIAHDVVEELVGTDAAFGVTLGDIVFDDLNVFDGLNRSIALIGIPWFNVIGNHDINYDAADDEHSDETFERVYGPAYYSFDYGGVHFVVLDNINWGGNKQEGGTGKYTGGFGKRQIEFVKNDVARVPEAQLIVLMMHIPLTDVTDREALYRLIENRPYTLSISGHTHYQEHRFIGKADGWRGKEPHHHIVNVTVCGTWWAGAPDESGIPHATMRDGAPNGYSILRFNGTRTEFEFKAARREKEYQMSLHAPEVVSAGEKDGAWVHANFFKGSEKARLRLRVKGQGDWAPMAKVEEVDPFYREVREREGGLKPLPGRELNAPVPSGHLWKARLPASLSPGVHLIEVEARDMYGKTFIARRVIRVTAGDGAE